MTEQKNNSFEIDYIPVGDGERGGDAIALKIGNLLGERGEQKIIVIDGGTKESGKQLVQRITKHYNNTKYIDSVICTHLHADHSSGLTEILNEFEVGELIMHLPWNHSAEIKAMLKGNFSTSGLKENLKKSLQSINELEKIATEKKIPIIEPFEGLKIQDNITVLGPNIDYYKELLVNFSQTPEPKKENVIVEGIKDAGKTILKWVSETIDFFTETLDDSGETSSENNSSIILLLEINEKRMLFTGDAGIPALNKAKDYAEAKEIDLSNIDFLDVPHHGSKRNIGKTLLDYFKPKIAIISAPEKGDPKHPSRKVINALKRRECRVVTTKGKNILHHGDNANNRGWRQAEEEPFFSEVED